MAQGPIAPLPATLYGITHSNRSGADLWGKNQFNSTFPAALACYMRDQNIPAVYIYLDEDLRVRTRDISIGDLFNTTLPNSNLKFDFETRYDPYQQYALGDIGGIDLVIRHHGDDSPAGWRRPLEVKLTVIPDDTTSSLAEIDWGPELVIRHASTKYCALGMYHACRNDRDGVRDIFQEVCGNFEVWTSTHEVRNKSEQLLNALNSFQRTFRAHQQPFLVQPIWKTEGKSPSLAAQAFDLFVWSDFALCRTFLDRSRGGAEVNRFMRASARLARVMYVLATQDRANLDTIYTEMTYGLLNDREFALSGRATPTYLDSPRRVSPALPRDVVAQIILNGGEKLLSPERRFDATIYFTTREVFDIREAEAQVAAEAAKIIREDGVN